MQRLWLTGQVLAVGANLQVRHVFRNGEDQTLEIIYAFMLPRDAALRRFVVKGEGFETHSELRRVEEAVKAYEAGIEAGHLATLARAYRDGVVNLTLGNLRKDEEVKVTMEILAGVELHDDGLRFRFPFTLAPGYHPSACTSPNGDLELPAPEFGDVILPKFRPSTENLHEVGFDLAVEVPGASEIASPSHAVQVGKQHVDSPPAPTFPIATWCSMYDSRAPYSDSLRRRAICDRRTVKPFRRNAATPRKVALVIDRSGSMGGQPMTQALRAVEACLGALSPEDQFALVAFDDHVGAFRDTLVERRGSENREAARAFSRQSMRGAARSSPRIRGRRPDGDLEATSWWSPTGRYWAPKRSWRGPGLFTSGFIVWESAAPARTGFSRCSASATGGVSRFVTPQERVDVAAVDLFASIGRPVAVDISASGAKFEIQPAKAVFSGTPWTVFGEGDAISVEWPGGSFTEPVIKTTPEIGETLRLIEGARRIAEAESMTTPDAGLAALSEKYGLASRAMASIAVVNRTADKADGPPPPRWFRSACLAVPGMKAISARQVRAPLPGWRAGGAAAYAVAERPRPKMALFRRRSPLLRRPTIPTGCSKSPPELESDGGVAGADPEDRALKTVSALFSSWPKDTRRHKALFAHMWTEWLAFLKTAAFTRTCSAALLRSLALVGNRTTRGPIRGNRLKPRSPNRYRCRAWAEDRRDALGHFQHLVELLVQHVVMTLMRFH